MAELLELGEAQETAGALDRVDHPKDTIDELSGTRTRLEGDQVAIGLIQVFEALDQEFANDSVNIVHVRRTTIFAALPRLS